MAEPFTGHLLVLSVVITDRQMLAKILLGTG
jgi:hypothetical protein